MYICHETEGQPGNSLAHAQHPVNLGDTEPVQNIRHQSLEPHVLDAGDVLGPFEIIRGAVFSAFSGVVHDCRVSVSHRQHFLPILNRGRRYDPLAKRMCTLDR